MKVAATMLVLIACTAALGACGSQGISVAKTSPYRKGAELFREHCSGCHTLSSVGAEGSASQIGNRVRTNGPNFNIRKENREQVLYAIRNGGFSGAIMPENIVVGPDAEAIAGFLAQYSGRSAQKVPSTNIKLSTGANEAAEAEEAAEKAKKKASQPAAAEAPNSAGSTPEAE